MPLESYQRSIQLNGAAAGLAFVRTLLDERYGGGLLRTAMQRRERSTEWEFLCASLELFEATEPSRPMREYSGLVLEEEWLSLAEIAARLTAPSETKVELKIRGRYPRDYFFNYAYGERNDTQEPLLGRAQAETSVYFSHDGNRAPDMDHRPAVAIGLPAHVSLADAASEWCLRKAVRHAGNFHERGRLTVIAPEVRASVVEAVLRDGALTLTTRTGKRTSGELRVLFETASPFGLDGPTIHAGPRALAAGIRNVHVIDVPEEAATVNAFVIESGTNDLVTHFRAWRKQIEAIDPLTTRGTDAELELAAGENEQVEFKPWLSKTDQKNNKMNELIKTVIAFANSVGGRLYVGVDDEGAPQGLAPLASLAPSPDQMLLEAKRMIDRELRNGSAPVPRFCVETLVVRGQSILAVTVQPGPRTPYATIKGHDVYIRSGATSRRPDPQSEMPSLYARGANVPGEG